MQVPQLLREMPMRFALGAEGVAAQERDGVLGDGVVPELLDPRRRCAVVAPEKLDHLAVDAYLAVATIGARLLDDLRDDRVEQVPVRQSAHHETREELGGI